MTQRTESEIVQVAPDYENAMIKHMELFGWSLQGRQEIHEEGDTSGGPSFLGDEYVAKTRVSHYVKLHFSRSQGLPNLDKIRALETEYNDFEVDFPALLPGGVIGFLILWPLLPFVYSSWKRRKEEADAELYRVQNRRRQINSEVAELLKE